MNTLFCGETIVVKPSLYMVAPHPIPPSSHRILFHDTVSMGHGSGQYASQHGKGTGVSATGITGVLHQVAAASGTACLRRGGVATTAAW
jgi:hypothetical protein